MGPGKSAVTFKPRSEGARGQGESILCRRSKYKIPEALGALKSSLCDWDKRREGRG